MGVEGLQVGRLFADADETHGHIEFADDGHQCSAARRAIELGHDQAGQSAADQDALQARGVGVVVQGKAIESATQLGGPRIRSGDLTPLAVTSPTRLKILPDVPTWVELGLMDTPLTAWYVIMAPKGTPKEIVDLLNTEFNRAVNSPRLRQQFEEVGGIVQTVSADELRRFMREEHTRWGQIVKSANLKPE